MLVSVSKLAKDVSGVGHDGNRFMESLTRIKHIAAQEKAQDKFGSLAAGAQIRVIAIIITCALWLVMTSFPSSLKEDLTMPEQQKPKTANDQKADQDLFDILIDLGQLLGKGLVGSIFCYYGIKKMFLDKKKGKKSAADLAIEEEMARLREAIEQDNSNAPAGSEKQKFAASLNGLTLMELFNGFAEIMAIRGDLPRQEDETALEYFRKVATEINFSKGKAELASHYFEDELYGQHETTEENRKAFLELILSMMEKVKPSRNRV